jgi:hypothetical protein
MRRSEYERLLTLRHRRPQGDMRDAPRRFLIAFGAAFAIMLAFWLGFTVFG